MQRLLWMICLLAGTVFSCTQTKTAQSLEVDPHAVTVSFPTDAESFRIKLSEVSSGEVVEGYFNIANHGNTPLVVTRAQHSCGCTHVEYSRQPIMPGDTLPASFTYDSRGKKGVQTGTITLYAASGETAVLHLEILVK